MVTGKTPESAGVFLNYSGSGKVGIKLNRYQTLGLSKELENLAKSIDNRLFVVQKERLMNYKGQ